MEIHNLTDKQRISELENRIAHARHIIEYAIKEASKSPQPQDMKTRLTFDFDDFNALCAILSIPQEKVTKE